MYIFHIYILFSIFHIFFFISDICPNDITIQPLPRASRPSHHAPRRGRHSEKTAGGGVEVGDAREPREKGVLAEIRELLYIYNLYIISIYIYNQYII